MIRRVHNPGGNSSWLGCSLTSRNRITLPEGRPRVFIPSSLDVKIVVVFLKTQVKIKMNRQTCVVPLPADFPEAGCNLLRAERFARKWGFVIEPIRRTGECRIHHPNAPDLYVKYNSRRKDAPRAMTTLIRQIMIRQVINRI
jgi:hypothetical protein